MQCSHLSPNRLGAYVILAGMSTCFVSLSLAVTPVRPLSQLKEQDPAKIIASAPASAQLVLPARYCRAKEEEIATLQNATNALVKGQIILQARIVELQNRQAALREHLVEARDAAALPTTKALYQAIIDWFDHLMGTEP